MTYRGILESQYFSMPASGTGTTVSAVFTKTGVRPIRIVAYRIIMLIGTQEGPDFQTSSVKCYSIPFLHKYYEICPGIIGQGYTIPCLAMSTNSTSHGSDRDNFLSIPLS